MPLIKLDENYISLHSGPDLQENWQEALNAIYEHVENKITEEVARKTQLDCLKRLSGLFRDLESLRCKRPREYECICLLIKRYPIKTFQLARELHKRPDTVKKRLGHAKLKYPWIDGFII